ncbi:hypothetical protein NYP20_11935 [Pseudomonas sp. N3-W]|uniref:Uncharacterized protein n=1 Tax=Pseudomonas fungipugnans TaxID=3024217 RepID=A0ABT6QWQ6_9PSED|nr:MULTISPECIES: hypothetical protein [unclassified Pseudomonas]MDI2595345.1 hypothetical protein [Pseudomonas sp. 681]UWF51627.1 hypothetical protein NYP20_11935 [Pseudomonas sp. N3-W]
MSTEQEHPEPDDELDEPTEDEIERQKRSTPDWKHPDDGKTLSERDQEWPLKP